MNNVEQELLANSEIEPSMLMDTLDSMFQRKVDLADLYFQSSSHESWMLEDGIVKEGSFNLERGVGVRAISGEKTGFAYSDDISPVALKKAADAAKGIANAEKSARVQVFDGKSMQQSHALNFHTKAHRDVVHSDEPFQFLPNTPHASRDFVLRYGQ